MNAGVDDARSVGMVLAPRLCQGHGTRRGDAGVSWLTGWVVGRDGLGRGLFCRWSP